MLFRVGDFSAMIAVVLYAIPPAVRYTDHGIRKIPPALIEAARTSGCTRRQLLWKVQMPLALPEIMLGRQPDHHVRAFHAGDYGAGGAPATWARRFTSR